MLRTYCRIIALIAMVAGPWMTAQAADETLTLACQGTAGSMGIVVNLTKRTVQGFGVLGSSDFPVNITAWNDVTVAFAGSNENQFVRESIMGSIDRVTGDVQVMYSRSRAQTGETMSSTGYALKCRPTQRMF